ncbi:hypothetical protein bthur0012_57910 [Bacillus thuringiensis serovar pulsiensis BGSC 4CC1]|nr:hypothetical protein bthur0012_57910 [Bacillus thuringiensis serovar pulsiensis BGSC 4CC1]
MKKSGESKRVLGILTKVELDISRLIVIKKAKQSDILFMGTT